MNGLGVTLKGLGLRPNPSATTSIDSSIGRLKI